MGTLTDAGKISQTHIVQCWSWCSDSHNIIIIITTGLLHIGCNGIAVIGSVWNQSALNQLVDMESIQSFNRSAIKFKVTINEQFYCLGVWTWLRREQTPIGLTTERLFEWIQNETIHCQSDWLNQHEQMFKISVSRYISVPNALDSFILPFSAANVQSNTHTLIPLNARTHNLCSMFLLLLLSLLFLWKSLFSEISVPNHWFISFFVLFAFAHEYMKARCALSAHDRLICMEAWLVLFDAPKENTILRC